MEKLFINGLGELIKINPRLYADLLWSQYFIINQCDNLPRITALYLMLFYIL